MKNFKRIIVLLVVTCLMTLSLCACGKKDDSDPNADPIVGTWKYSGCVYTFNNDGTGTYDVYGSLMNMKWTIDEARTTLTIVFLEEGYGEDKPFNIKFSLDGNVLKITDSFGNVLDYEKQ